MSCEYGLPPLAAMSDFRSPVVGKRCWIVVMVGCMVRWSLVDVRLKFSVSVFDQESPLGGFFGVFMNPSVADGVNP